MVLAVLVDIDMAGHEIGCTVPLGVWIARGEHLTDPVVSICLWTPSTDGGWCGIEGVRY